MSSKVTRSKTTKTSTHTEQSETSLPIAIKSEKSKSVSPTIASTPGISSTEQTICVIRIRGAHGMNRRILYTLQLMNLHSVNSATLLRSTPSTRGMLQKAKDYIAFGPINEETIKSLLKKRAILTGNKPLTDNHIRFSTVYKSVDDLANALHEGKIQLREIKDLKPVFRLHPPVGGYRGSVKKAIHSGGVLGNVGDKINLYLKKMI